MPDDPTRCAICGAIIVPAGEAWDHVGEPKPRHPAIPVGEWQAAPEPSGPIEDAEIERILAMSDEEIIAEARREGLNPELEARYLRRLFENAVEMVKLRERAERAERNYMAAVHDRVQFRAALRKARADLAALEAAAAHNAPLVAAALAWLPEHAEYTAGCATCERLVEAARAWREAPDVP